MQVMTKGIPLGTDWVWLMSILAVGVPSVSEWYSTCGAAMEPQSRVLSCIQ